MSCRSIRLAGNLLIPLLVCMGCAKERGSTENAKTGNPGGRAVYVERFPNGYALIRYSGAFARELSTAPSAEDVVVLFDGASRPIYALRPMTGETIEFYKVVSSSNRELIYAIPVGPYETRVYEGPIHPEDGFPKRITTLRDVPEIDDAYLHPSARQKALWLEGAPNLGALETTKPAARVDATVAEAGSPADVVHNERLRPHTACEVAAQQIRTPDRIARTKGYNSFESSCSTQQFMALLDHDPSKYVRFDAAQVLIDKHIVDAVPGLIELLRSTEDDAQMNFPEFVIEGLASSHDIRAVPVLIEKLNQEQNFQVRNFAAYALGELQDTRAVKPLVLAAAGSDGHHYSMGDEAFKPLLKIGHPAVPLLMQMFRDPNYKDDREVKMVVAAALGKLRDPVAIPLLHEMLESKDLDFQYVADSALDEMDAEQLRQWESRRKVTRIAAGVGITAVVIILAFVAMFLWRNRIAAR